MAIGWRQFEMTNSNFRQSGVACTTNGRLDWTFPGNLDPGNLLNVMFSRSTDGGRTWSVPLRFNDDSPDQNVAHWFGTLSVAPDGRIDACWNDTRHSEHS